MRKRKIANIVIYGYNDNMGNHREACIFYKGGNVETVSWEDAIKAVHEIAKENNIISEKGLTEMYENNNIIHVMSKREFEKRYDEFIPKSILDEETIGDTLFELLENKISHEEMLPEDEDILGEEEDVLPEDEDILEEEDVLPEDEDILGEEEDVLPEDKESTIINYKKGKSKNIFERFKVQVSAVALTIIIAITSFGMNGCGRKTLSGIMANSNISLINLKNKGTEDEEEENTKENDENLENNSKNKEEEVKTPDNSNYNDKTYEELLKLTTNETQKEAMTKVKDFLIHFNGQFADAYVEEGKDIRAALTYDEVMALLVAFNNYSKEDLRAIFNGEEIDSNKMGRDYRSAYLQLLGAFIIEKEENPLELSILINSEEGKEQFEKYHQQYLKIKKATGEERRKLVEEYYDNLREDYPITEEKVTEGIAHADDYTKVDETMLPVMILTAAVEATEQNNIKDHTLSNLEVEYTNDIGGCQFAYDKYGKLEIIMLAATEDKTNPTLNQYRTAMNKYLEENNINVKTDAERELSNLDAFKKAVNPYYEGYYEYMYKTIEETTEYYSKKQWEEVTYEKTGEVTTIEEREIPESEKNKIDKKYAEENKKAKENGEAEADKKAEEMQKELDKEAELINREVEENREDLDNNINNANNTINQNNQDTNQNNDTKVNEKDLGHKVDFDNNNSDQDGNLNDSVENITTNPTGDQTDKDLQNPNDTEKEFEERVEKRQIPEQTDNIEDQQEESTENNQVNSSDEEESNDSNYEDNSEEESNDSNYENNSEEESNDNSYEDNSEEESNDSSYEDNSEEESNDSSYEDNSEEESNDNSYEDNSEEESNDNSYESDPEPEPQTSSNNDNNSESESNTVTVEVDENTWYEYEAPEEENTKPNTDDNNAETEKEARLQMYERAVDAYLAYMDNYPNNNETGKSYIYV